MVGLLKAMVLEFGETREAGKGGMLSSEVLGLLCWLKGWWVCAGLVQSGELRPAGGVTETGEAQLTEVLWNPRIHGEAD